MSQIYKTLASGPIPPTIATRYNTDVNSPAIPAANQLNVVGGETSINNVNGIQTDGSSGSNTLTVKLTNRITGTVSTTGAVNANVLTFTAPATPGVYDLTINVVAFDSVDLIGSTYTIDGSVLCNGAALSTIGSPVRTMDGTVDFNATQVSVSVAGLVIDVVVTGLAGKTIKWTGLMTYVFGGA